MNTKTVSPISVIGMGQCGSNLALALSLEVDPLAPLVPELTGLVKLKLELKRVLWERNRRGVTQPMYSSNDFYIADMNVQNQNYVDGLKMAAMREFIVKEPAATFANFLDYSTDSYAGYGFDLNDEKLFAEIRTNPQAGANVEMLKFRKGSDDFHRDGAGGMQFLSEFLSVADRDLYERIAKRGDGTLIGIFSSGGGTGAGSVFGVLTKYKRETARYTLGLSILPGRGEGTAAQRTGRFLSRYLSKAPSARFDTLLLFSNAAAMTVAAVSDAELDNAKTTALGAVNDYLSKFLYYYSLINQPINSPRMGKVFDPADARTSLHEPSVIGFGFKRGEGDDSPKRVFIDALAPVQMNAGLMTGMGAFFDEDPSVYSRLRSLLESATDAAGEDRNFADTVAEINKCTRFYATLKRVWVFFFVSDDAGANAVSRFVPAIEALFRGLTGVKSEGLSISVYQPREMREPSVMILCSGGYSEELLEYFMAYVREGFFPDDDVAFDEFHERFLEILRDCHRPLSNNEIIKCKESVAQLFGERVKREHEAFTRGQQSAIDANPSYRAIVASGEFANFRIKKTDIIAAAQSLIELAVRPRKSPSMRGALTES